MSLPDYQPTRLPEGEYRFVITDYEKKKHPRADGGVSVTVKFTFKVELPGGSPRRHIESIACWEDRYGDLLLAIGGTKDEKGIAHLSETNEVIGSSFKAAIIHERDKDDPTKTWARVNDIRIPYQMPDIDPARNDQEEEDVPMPNENNGEPGEPEDEEPLPF